MLGWYWLYACFQQGAKAMIDVIKRSLQNQQSGNPQSLMTHHSQRDSAIDILRGIAIITMLLANLMGSTTAEPHPLSLRAAGSFAAPLFILLAGMMVGRGIEKKGYNISYFSKRGLFLILIAAIICDMLIWGVLPFLNMEVLYLIGISLPIVAALYRLPVKLQLLIVIAIFALTPLLQTLVGYKPGVFGYFIPKSQATLDYVLTDLHRFLQTGYLKQVFIDGWFPVFPWIGFALLGGVIAKLRWANNQQHKFASRRILIGSILVVTIGIIIWRAYPGALYVRLGFSELFYPATPGYIVTAIGVIALLFWIADKQPQLSIWRPVKIMGESALFLYLLHWIIIDHIIDRFAQKIDINELLLWYLLLISTCFGIAYLLTIVRKKSPNMPAAVKFILG